MGWLVEVCRLIIIMLCIIGGKWLCCIVGIFVVCTTGVR